MAGKGDVKRYIDDIFKNYQENKNTEVLHQRLRNFGEEVDVSAYEATLWDLVFSDSKFYNLLTEEKNFTIIKKGKKQLFSSFISEEINNDIEALADLLSKDIVRLEDIAHTRAFKECIQSWEYGDISKIVAYFLKSDLDDKQLLTLIISNFADALLEASDVFQQKTGNLQLFRFLMLCSPKDRDLVKKIEQTYKIDLPKEGGTGQYISANILSLVASLPNHKLFNECLAAFDVEETDYYYKMIREGDGYAQTPTALTTIFDYIAIAPIAESEREKRYQAVLKKQPDLESELFGLRYEQAAPITHRYMLGIGTNTSFPISWAVTTGLEKQNELANMFFSHYKKRLKDLSLKDREILSELSILMHDPKGASSFDYRYDAERYEKISLHVDMLSQQWKIGSEQINEKTSIEEVSRWISLSFLIYNHYNKEEILPFLNLAAVICRERKEDFCPYVYYAYMLKLSVLMKENLLTEKELDYVRDNHSFFETEYIERIENRFTTKVKIIKEESERVNKPAKAAWKNMSVLWLSCGITSFLCFIFIGTHPNFLWNFIVDLVLKITSVIVSLIAFYYAFKPCFNGNVRAVNAAELSDKDAQLATLETDEIPPPYSPAPGV